MLFGMADVTYHLQVMVTLTSDLVFLSDRVWSISLILFDVGISKSVENASWDDKVSGTIIGSL